jgi:hypothetical protein
MLPGISLRHFSIMIGAVALIACVFELGSLSSSRGVAGTASADEGFSPVVGVWEVSVGNAPFGPHLFTFHSDHTFLSSNPDAGDPHTSDSDGEGVWQDIGHNKVTGIFKEYDADRTTNQFVGTLTVTYTIKIKGNTFTGNASATETDPSGDVVPGFPLPATFTAYRLGTAPKGFPPA